MKLVTVARLGAVSAILLLNPCDQARNPAQPRSRISAALGSGQFAIQIDATGPSVFPVLLPISVTACARGQVAQLEKCRVVATTSSEPSGDAVTRCLILQYNGDGKAAVAAGAAYQAGFDSAGATLLARAKAWSAAEIRWRACMASDTPMGKCGSPPDVPEQAVLDRYGAALRNGRASSPARPLLPTAG